MGCIWYYSFHGNQEGMECNLPASMGWSCLTWVGILTHRFYLFGRVYASVILPLCKPPPIVRQAGSSCKLPICSNHHILSLISSFLCYMAG